MRVTENKEMRKKFNEISEAKGTDMDKMMSCMFLIMDDISLSLAVIADVLKYRKGDDRK